MSLVDRFLAAVPDLPVLVVGDLMLDAYVRGRADRISPEAPVQVVTVEGEECRLGGAGNVAVNLAGLGCRVRFAGAVGDDGDGRLLEELLGAAGVRAAGLVRTPERATCRKTRVLAGHQQIVRIDREDRRPLPADCEARLVRYLEGDDAPCRAILVSDYAKGTLSDRILAAVFERAGRLGVPVVVDPKGRDFLRYRGASVLTPNRGEVRLAAGLPEADGAALAAAAAALRDALELDALVMTRSEEGMSLFFRGGRHLRLGTRAREVFDVTGAGDTVLAFLGAGLAAGLGVEEAAAVANLAAGVVVGKSGTAGVSPAELLWAVEAARSPEAGKLCSREALAALLAAERRRGHRVVFTNGCFDLLHVGHVQLLQKAREKGDLLVLGLNSDASIRRLKGPERPLIGQDERAHILAALDCVDYVVLFDEDTPLELIRALRPDVLVKGGDYAPHEVVGREFVEGYGGRVELVRLVEGHSTSDLIRRILATCGER